MTDRKKGERAPASSTAGPERALVPMPVFPQMLRSRRTAAAAVITSLLALVAAVLFTMLLLVSGFRMLEGGADSLFLRELSNGFLTALPASVLYDVGGSAAGLETKSEDLMTETPEASFPPSPGADAAPENGACAVVFRDLSAEAVPAVTNHTAYTLDYRELLTLPAGVETPDTLYKTYGKSAPVVLIVHTHGTEAYRAEEAMTGEAGDDYRSDSPAETIVAVGDVLAEVLVASGINTMHCTVMFDKDSYSGAYAASAAVIRALTEKYPSIRYVLDVHRDALLDTGVNYAAVTDIGGERFAQFMMVIGTDEGGADHPRWRECLGEAMRLQAALGADYPTLVRKISLRSASFNAQYAPVSLLMEFGTCGNTLREAKRTAVLVGAALSEQITGAVCPADLGALLDRYR